MKKKTTKTKVMGAILSTTMVLSMLAGLRHNKQYNRDSDRRYDYRRNSICNSCYGDGYHSDYL